MSVGEFKSILDIWELSWIGYRHFTTSLATSNGNISENDTNYICATGLLGGWLRKPETCGENYLVLLEGLVIGLRKC